MITSKGHYYKAIINVKMAVEVAAHDEDDVEDIAMNAVTDALEGADAYVNVERIWCDAVYRGEEALDIIREDE